MLFFWKFSKFPASFTEIAIATMFEAFWTKLTVAEVCFYGKNGLITVGEVQSEYRMWVNTLPPVGRGLRLTGVSKPEWHHRERQGISND